MKRKWKLAFKTTVRNFWNDWPEGSKKAFDQPPYEFRVNRHDRHYENSTVQIIFDQIIELTDNQANDLIEFIETGSGTAAYYPTLIHQDDFYSNKYENQVQPKPQQE